MTGRSGPASDAELIWTGGKESWGRVDMAMANKQCFSTAWVLQC